MRTYIGSRRAVTAADVLELALGTPAELWLGVDGESEEDQAARLAAARDILAEDPQMVDRVTAVAAEAIESYAPHLLGVRELTRPTKAESRRVRRAA
ncbi:hypothetical protein [Streptomyces huiliensis]|uniref:hypothetical protein n=1 Tax=Streptomyces huiliensis TaxID=2876027 RepID=UPI001CBCBCC2|nr:hypothetical protein [Streptomyces huiliensis]MBZ4319392.1 hypothetical protein [Streptomyces huiliensis]